MTAAIIRNPAYVNRDFEHDLKKAQPSWLYQQASRVAQAVLPFLTLYRPLSYPLSLIMGTVRLFTNSSNLWAERQNPEISQLLQVAASAAGVVGTYFRHPLGMLIATMHDFFLDFGALVGSMRGSGDTKEALLRVISDLLYGALFFSGSPPLVASSLALHAVSGFYQGFKTQDWLLSTSHILMGLIRGHQAIRTYQAICIEKEMREAKAQNKPYLPVANRAQKFFVEAGYRLNSMGRSTLAQIFRSHLFAPLPADGKIQEIGARALAALKIGASGILSLPGFFACIPFYMAASYTGTGRFEVIRSTAEQPVELPEDGKNIRVMFQNICGQNPYSLLTDETLTPPLEKDERGNCRLDGNLQKVLKEKPHIYAAQECEDLDTSKVVAERFAEAGYDCVRDLGCDDFVSNHSGGFLALPKGGAEMISFAPIPLEHRNPNGGLFSWSNRGILSATLPLKNEKSLTIGDAHLYHGDTPADHEARLKQLQHDCVPLIDGKAGLVVGDLNLDTSSLTPEDRKRVHLDHLSNAFEGKETCRSKKDGIEKIDGALYDPKYLTVSAASHEPNGSDHDLCSLTLDVL